jgi:hydroxyacylglutathione hydrolase
MKLPVEDDFNDIIGKAQKGQGLSTEELSRRTVLSEDAIRKARRGDFEESAVASLGEALGLNVEALLAIGRCEWYPAQPEFVEGFELISTPFYDMHVNAYLLWDPKTKEAIAFDTGTSPSPMLQRIDELGLRLKALFLTHSHGDHIEGASEILEKTGAQALISRLEPEVSFDAVKIDEGYLSTVGVMRIRMIDTPGHTSGGATFVVDGLARKYAIVGDAIFAGSMGGANVSYEQGLTGVKNILNLPDDTIIASGHGPLTTVGQEKRMNCFYAP